MARLNVRSERVRRLVEQRVIPLFLAAGSTAALTKALNEALADSGAEGTLHPNRLHALLSDDVSRGLNEATLALVERAAELAAERDPALPARADEELARLRGEADRLRRFGGAAPDEVARRLGVPPAVAALVDEKAAANAAGALSELAEELTGGTTLELQSPDWSYQDTAVARCLAVFERRPTARVGLILPTGAGKTRTALRVVLALLAKLTTEKGPVYWVTHRKNLRAQAHRELQRILSQTQDQVPADATALLANRIKFVMVGDLSRLMDPAAVRPALIVVDEAHHAAAPSYQLVFEAPWPVPVLLLTATPNRTDRLPIGMDEIAFTITYRELAERGAILAPTFLDFPVDDFDWSPTAVRDLADYVVDRTAAEFTKVLVLAPRVDRVEEFHAALAERLAQVPGHPLDEDDVGFVHGGGNSLGVENEDFLALFAAKPRAVLVSAQLLIEGFDDPSINTVVLTYPTMSVIRLMQAAGRCVRYAPGKRAAYVVQARNDQIAYHFDQRWLYQEIDDYLRPELVDVDYGTVAELRERVRALLSDHNVDVATITRLCERIEALEPGETCRVLLYGLPYYGTHDAFAAAARWGAVLETTETSSALRGLFNGFCGLGAELSDPSDFLARDGAAYGIVKDLRPGSRWLQFSGLLTACYFASREVHGPEPAEASSGSRPYRRAGPTTWLKYVTFHFRPAVPQRLAAFLRDCHNAAEIEAAFLESPVGHTAAVKVPLPLGGFEAFLLDASAVAELDDAAYQLRTHLAEAEPGEQFGVLAAFLAGARCRHVPARLLWRLEFLLGEAARTARILSLQTSQPERK